MRAGSRLLLFSFAVGVAVLGFHCRTGVPVATVLDEAVPLSRPPRIHPDYAGIVIPPNIAPLNFVVKEPGKQYVIRVTGTGGGTVEVVSRHPDLRFPLRPWRALLAANRGKQLHATIAVREPDGTWRKFKPVVNTVAREPIDRYLTYRFITSAHNIWYRIEIRQRDLTTFTTWPVLRNRSFDKGCVNCHTFLNNGTRAMTLGIRSRTYGSCALLIEGRRVTRIGTRFGYTAWHPSGRVVAYSLNKVHQYFHNGGEEVRDVVDLESAIAYYDVARRLVKTNPQFSDHDRLETYPTWSPDGRYLYFCSAPILWTDRRTVPPKHYEETRYSLKRISYDVDHDRWGTAETVLSAEKTGKSLLLPRIAPDGRFLLFCMCDYGCFPIYQPSSDLYLLDLKTNEYRRLTRVNSRRSESWHSWSANSRWFVFSSKRRDGIYTRPYFCHVDEKGRVSKPFLLPTSDPVYFDSLLMCLNVPELSQERVRVSSRALTAAIRSPRGITVQVPIKFTPRRPGAPSLTPAGHPWRSGGSTRK